MISRRVSFFSPFLTPNIAYPFISFPFLSSPLSSRLLSCPPLASPVPLSLSLVWQLRTCSTMMRFCEMGIFALLLITQTLVTSGSQELDSHTLVLISLFVSVETNIVIKLLLFLLFSPPNPLTKTFKERADALLKMHARPGKSGEEDSHMAESVQTFFNDQEHGIHKHDREKVDVTPDWFFKVLFRFHVLNHLLLFQRPFLSIILFIGTFLFVGRQQCSGASRKTTETSWNRSLWERRGGNGGHLPQRQARCSTSPRIHSRKRILRFHNSRQIEASSRSWEDSPLLDWARGLRSSFITLSLLLFRFLLATYRMKSRVKSVSIEAKGSPGKPRFCQVPFCTPNSFFSDPFKFFCFFKGWFEEWPFDIF